MLRPILRLPDGKFFRLSYSKPGGGGSGKPISEQEREYQINKISPKINQLIDSLKSGFAVQNDTSGISPERALVFVVKGSGNDFSHAIKSMGFDFLRMDDLEYEEDDIKETRHFYASMPNLSGLNKLVKLWEKWEKKVSLPYGEKKWEKLFNLLRDLRVWGPEDRISILSVDHWKHEIAKQEEAYMRIELEFWFYPKKEKRLNSSHKLQRLIQNNGGKILHAPEEIEEIAYHGMLVEIPRESMNEIIENKKGFIAECDEILFAYPQTVASVKRSAINEDEIEVENELLNNITKREPQEKIPFAGLIDGVPVENHKCINNFIIIDDPDNLASFATVDKRWHGTQMASLIINGDLNDKHRRIIKHPLYVRPVIFPSDSDYKESSSSNHIFLDTIYRAIVRMKDGEFNSPSTARDVFIINISLAVKNLSYCNFISPLARLLDFLSYKYKILFLVSAGNINEPLLLKNFKSWIDFENASDEERKISIANAMIDQQTSRTLLSPAESMNVLTIGASHKDSIFSDGIFNRKGYSFDPFPNENNFPNVVSAIGLGFKKSVKPDIFFPGGKERLICKSSDPNAGIEVKPAERGYGLKSASPPRVGVVSLSETDLATGTSAATALATHYACRIFENLKYEQETNNSFSAIPERYNSVVVKALLMHCAKWNNHSECFGNVKKISTRFLGFGNANIEMSLGCTANRATLIGCGEISKENIIEKKCLLHSIPLPNALKGKIGEKKITITLTWLSSINASNQKYNLFKLIIHHANELKNSVDEGKNPYDKDWGNTLGVEKSNEQPGPQITGRGTVSHLIYKGEEAAEFIDGEDLKIAVEVKEIIKGSIEDSIVEPILYGLAVTIETEKDLPIYDSIKSTLAGTYRPPVTV